MADKIKLTEGLDDLLQTAIAKGLQRADANMVRVVNDMRRSEEGTDILKDLSISVVPYEIKDVSLRTIVLQAPDYVIDEITDALAERRRIAEFGGMKNDG